LIAPENIQIKPVGRMLSLSKMRTGGCFGASDRRTRPEVLDPAVKLFKLGAIRSACTEFAWATTSASEFPGVGLRIGAP
jgi:hypothetical protein